MSGSVKNNVIWTTLGRYSQMVISLAVTMVLSRYLTPSEFGIVATVLIFNNFLYTFIDAGIPSAIIQKKELCERDLVTFNSIGLSIGIVLLIIICLSSQSISNFFDVVELEFLLPVMSVNFIMLGLLGVPTGILQRELKFASLAKVEFVSSCISGVIAVYLAVNGLGYWSLVIQLMIQLFIRLIMSILLSGYFSVKFYFNKASLEYIKTYSGYLVLFSSINYWSRNFDNLIIAKFFSEKKLGIYSQAYRLMFLPVQLISSIINALIHPYFAKKFNEGGSFYNGYIVAFTLSLLFSAPIACFIFFNPTLVLKLVWGEQWIIASNILKILSILSLIQPALVTTGDVFKSTNNNKLLFKVGMVNSIFTVVAIYIGATISFESVAISYVLIYLFFVTPVTIYFICSRALRVTVVQFVRDIFWVTVVISILFSCNYTIAQFSNSLGLLFYLAIAFSVNAIILVLSLLYFYRFKFEKAANSNKFSCT